MKNIKDLSFRKGRRRRKLCFSRSFIAVIIVPAFTLLITNCKKEDDKKENPEPVIREMVNDISADSLEAHIKKLENMGTRFTFAPNRLAVARSIKNKFISMGYDSARIDSFFVTKIFRNVEYSMWQYNVSALINGTDYPDSVCILGAHFDSYNGTGDPFTAAPGAHDNASGVAATIEVARVMKKHDFKPEKSIMFLLFGAEEIGLYGSSRFSANPGEFYGKISFMVNNDMIAWEPSDNPESWQVNILDYANSHSLRKDAEKLILQYTSLSYINDNTYNKYSDSYPFSLAGYKAIFFSSVKTDPYYHTINDVSANLNFRYCSEITRASCAVMASGN